METEEKRTGRVPLLLYLRSPVLGQNRPGIVLMSGFLCIIVISSGCVPLSSRTESDAVAGVPTGWRIALYPFDNLTFEPDAKENVMPLLRARLEEKGIYVAGEDAFMDILLEERIRSSGYLPHDLAQRLHEQLEVSTFMTGSIVAYSKGSNPELGIVARLVDPEGKILWASYASASGEDFVTVLGLGGIGRIEDLVPVVIDRLLADLGNAFTRTRERSDYRTAVLLFQNQSPVKDAGKIVSYLFLEELARRSAFVTVEYGDIRSFMVEQRIRPVGEMDFEAIGELQEHYDIDGVILGSVEEYDDGALRKTPPRVAISARLVDARTKKIQWYDREVINGNDEIIMLEWGKMRTVDKVARRVVEKLVNRLESGK